MILFLHMYIEEEILCLMLHLINLYLNLELSLVIYNLIAKNTDIEEIFIHILTILLLLDLNKEFSKT